MGDVGLPAYEVDTSCWPIVTLRPTVAVREMAALDLTYVAMDAVLARKETFVVALDLRGSVSSAERRRRFNDWVERNGAAIRRYAVANAVIASSTVERGFVTAALWFLTPPIPMRVFATPRDAEAWLQQQYEARTRQPPSTPPR